MISIILPTIKGREHWLARCVASYEATLTCKYELKIFHDYPNCNAAWNVGLREISGEIVHITADDIEAHPGWVESGLKALEQDFIPCPRILNPDGTLQSCGDDDQENPDGTPSVVARIPLFKREWADYFLPIPEMQYMGDHWITAKCEEQGIPTLVVRDYLFTHGFAKEGRMDTLNEDVKKYKRALAR